MIVDRIVIPAAAIAAAASTWVVGLMWTEPHPIADFRRLVWPEQVHAGEVINIKAAVTRARGGCSSTATRRWLNEAGIDMAPPEIQQIPALPAGGETFMARITVPPDVKPGMLIMRTSVEFFCNPVQATLGGTTLPLHDIVFQVLP